MMLKPFPVLALILLSNPVYADSQSPWFGGEASPPAQIALEATGSISPINNPRADCAIYDCAPTDKIAKPFQKSASNP
jgi:hypothetical protein